jgi:hypothetical protein
LKRAIIFTSLVIFCVVCFWYALSGVNTPPPAQEGATSSHTANPSQSGGRPSQAGAGQTPTSGNSKITVGAGSGGGGGGGSGPATAATTNARGGAASNPLLCKSLCQTNNSMCQAACYQSHSVTDDTPGWIACMQACNVRTGSCATGCANGAAPPPPVPPIPTASSAKPSSASTSPAQSKPTPSLPIQMPDSSVGQ